MCTKNDLLALTARLRACNFPTAMAALLHESVQEPKQARNSYERMPKGLGPTVNTLCALWKKLELEGLLVGWV